MRPIVGIDFETSGYCTGHNFSAVEIGLCELGPNGRLSAILNTKLSGATKISRPAAKTHGITLEDCKGQPTLESFWSSFRVLQRKVPLCGHAIGTERKILRSKFPLAEFIWLDTLKLSKYFFPQCPNYKLRTVCEFLRLDSRLQEVLPNRSWHSALFDATASVLIIEDILKRYPTFQLEDLLNQK